MEVSPQRHSFSEQEKTAMKIQELNIVLGNILIFLYVFTITSSCTDRSDFQSFLRKVCICSIYFQSLKGLFKTMLFYVDQLWRCMARQSKDVTQGGPVFSYWHSRSSLSLWNTWDTFSVFSISQPERERKENGLHFEHKNIHRQLSHGHHGSVVLAMNLCAVLCTSPLLSPRHSKEEAVQREDLAKVKDNSQPESPHPDETQTFTQIVVLNKNRESWVAAKQKNTSSPPKKTTVSAPTSLAVTKLVFANTKWQPS